MKCPECGAWTIVRETRSGVLRTRECANLHRFRTEEVFRGLVKKRKLAKETSRKETQ